MNITRLQVTKQLLTYARLIYNVQTIQRLAPGTGYYSTFTIDAFTSTIHDRYRLRFQSNDLKDRSVQKCEETNANPKYNAAGMTNVQLDDKLSELLSKNRDKPVKDLVIECQNCRKFFTFATLKKLYRHYSMNGNPHMVAVLQTYCEKVDPVSYKKNGEFLHYLAKAQCIKGNSDKGLAILKGCYKKYDSLRSFYRIIFRELIQDSVLNRSEASLVIFTKYVLEFSKEWSDHYPLVCFWHICWASTWFSDQMLANELLESSTILQNIVKDKATAFSMMALKDYNEDAVVRLLQTLLKYDMMSEYVMVLQVLFTYKLRKRDIRGCSEIIRNCDTLGVTLPSNQQGRYIRMLIDDKRFTKEETTKTPSKDFRLKF